VDNIAKTLPDGPINIRWEKKDDRIAFVAFACTHILFNMSAVE
jgi:hypothetical protein